MTIVSSIIDDAGCTIDSGAAGVLKVIYAGGPEDLYDLFVTAAAHVVAVVGEPSVTPERFIQDEQVYETYDVPVRVYAINKHTSAGALTSTAPRTLFKCVNAMLLSVTQNAHSSSYVIRATRGAGSVVRRAGMDFHEQMLTFQVRWMVA